MLTLPEGFRVAYVCADPGVPVFGKKGCSGHVQEVMRAFARAGARVDAFATRVDEPAPDDLLSVRLHHLPPAPKGEASFRERQCLMANRQLRSELERAGPFDLVYERYSLWSHAGMEYARRHGTPSVLEVNAPLIEEQLTYRELMNVEAAERTTRRTLDAASVIAAVSSGVADYLRSKYPEAGDRVHVIPNGVNVHRFHPRVPPALNGSKQSITIGFVGHLKPWHGVEVLADAVGQLQSRLRNIRLLIVGDGPAREQLMARLTRHRLQDPSQAQEAVTLPGRVDPAEVPGLIASMDIATAPYPNLPGFYFSPLKLFEYWAVGVPVVASGIGQLVELIDHGRSGLLVPPGDCDALAGALEMLARDPALRQRLSATALEKVRRDHTWEAVVSRVLELSGACRTRSSRPVVMSVDWVA